MSLEDSRSRQDRHFERRLEAAKAGRHLPTEIELLRGMPFLSDDMAADLREFAERLSRRLRHNPKFESALLIAMNRPGFAGGSNFQIGWSHDEQNDEQVFP